MKIHSSTWLLTVVVLASACEKDPAPVNPPETQPVAGAEETGDPAPCQSSYSVVGAVNGGVLTESIGGEAFTDEDPFECTLRSRDQSVPFSFNASTTDPSNQCRYTLGYTSEGTAFSGTQTLSCSRSSLEFTVTATVAAGQPSSCPSPIVEDPKVVLTTTNCGGAGAE